MTLVRKTPLKRKAEAPEKKVKGPKSCTQGRCVRAYSVKVQPDERLCTTHANELADKLVGEYVKRQYDNRCMANPWQSSFWMGADIKCSGGRPQWAHLEPFRRGHFGTRWNPDATITLCNAHHVWHDHHPAHGVAMSRAWLGEEEWDRLLAMRDDPKPDLAEIIVEFRKRVAT